MGHQQGGQALAHAAVDAECGHFAGQFHRYALFRAQVFQRGNHVAGPGQLRCCGIGAEFALAREPHDDNAGQNAQDDLGKDGRDDEAETGTILVLEDHPVDKASDDPGEEHDEGVYHTLDQGQGHHVAIGHVADLVGHDSLHFVGAEALEHALGDSHQRSIAIPAGGECVRRP